MIPHEKRAVKFPTLVVFQIVASVLILLGVVCGLWQAGFFHISRSQVNDPGSWRFMVSGDSRNCGDVVMPTIASHGLQYSPAFYWHLGDLRAIYKIDEDMRAEYSDDDNLSCEVYHGRAWSDFVRNQVAPFGRLPFYIGIGNHEVIPPKTEQQFKSRFKDWLMTETIVKQRLLDGEKEPLTARPYYHWVQRGVDFIYLDNALDIFSEEQLQWFDETVARDGADHSGILSIVVGMHEALPGSIASDHAMCDDPKKLEGCASGRHVYERLARLQKKKPVYVLASHSHFYMEGIFDALPPDRRLPGWIVGTAGAVRYKTPPNSPSTARQDVYGYLLGTVEENGQIRFEFQQVRQSDVPTSVYQRFAPSLVPWCFVHNSANVDVNPEEGSMRCSPPARSTMDLH